MSLGTIPIAISSWNSSFAAYGSRMQETCECERRVYLHVFAYSCCVVAAITAELIASKIRYRGQTADVAHVDAVGIGHLQT